MIGVTLVRALVGVAVIIAIFAAFALFVFRARRRRTFKAGGRSYWDILFGKGRGPRGR
jgi:hypothetical protein